MKSVRRNLCRQREEWGIYCEFDSFFERKADLFVAAFARIDFSDISFSCNECRFLGFDFCMYHAFLCRHIVFGNRILEEECIL